MRYVASKLPAVVYGDPSSDTEKLLKRNIIVSFAKFFSANLQILVDATT